MSSKAAKHLQATQIAYRDEVLRLWDEYASKAAVAHAVVQRKAAALFNKLAPHLISLGLLSKDAELPKWVLWKGNWGLSFWRSPAHRCRFDHRPEDWDYDEAKRMRAAIYKNLTPGPSREMPTKRRH